jgi:hypothetical protein
MSTLERVRFVRGGALAARDVQDEVRGETVARELHVRALHDTWGVALGYAVGLAGPWLVVGPGLAYDHCGRELLSSRTVALRAPRRPLEALEWIDLAVRRRADDELDRDEPLCSGGPLEQPRFVWAVAGEVGAGEAPAPADGLRLGEAVPIARVRVSKGRIVDVSLAERRAARPSSGARVAGGSVAIELPADSTLASELEIDTSAANFQAVPFYFASWSIGGAAVTGPLRQGDLVGPFLSISNPRAAGFTLGWRFGTVESAKLEQADPGIRVDWIGVEPIRGCWPGIDPYRALAAEGLPLSLLAAELGSFAYQPALGPLVPLTQEA